MIKLRATCFSLLALSFAPVASAEPFKCTSAKDLLGAMTTMAEFPEALTDSLKLTLQLRATRPDGSALNERVYALAPDGTQTDLPILADNTLTGTHALAGADAQTQLCRAGLDGQAVTEKSQMQADLTFDFNHAGGVHQAATLIDGVQDGTAQMKALAPAAVRLFVPKLKYIVVAPAEKGAPLPVLTALRGDSSVTTLRVQYVDGMPAFSVADLKKSKADRIRIEGAAYTLMAMPKPGRDDLSDSPNLKETAQ